MRVVGLDYPDAGFGHKFVLPDIQGMTKLDNFRKRYDPVVDQVTKSIMKHGKLSKAQSVWCALFFDSLKIPCLLIRSTMYHGTLLIE